MASAIQDLYFAVARKCDPGLSTNRGSVDTPPSKDEIKLAALIKQTRSAVPRGVGRGSKGKNNEIRTILNYTNTFVTVAASDNSTVLLLNPSSSTEFTTFASLWDEIIVDSGHIDFTCAITTNYTSANGQCRAVVAFDPVTAAALGSLSNGLQHSQHFQFQHTNATTMPASLNKTGVYHFRWKTPRGTAREKSDATLFGHDWSPTAESNNIYGYLKWYIPSVGATGLSTVYYTTCLNCRFRCRS